jgi:hypothetical protein
VCSGYFRIVENLATFSFENFQFAGPQALDIRLTCAAKSKKGKIKKIGRLSVASLQRKHNPLRMIIFATVSPNSYVTLSLRNTTKWIDELWTRRIITAYDAGFQNLSMEVMQDCADEFEIFVWEHFVKKYGSKHEASIHVGDFVVSLRKHRDSSHRVRIFSGQDNLKK